MSGWMFLGPAAQVSEQFHLSEPDSYEREKIALGKRDQVVFLKFHSESETKVKSRVVFLLLLFLLFLIICSQKKTK